jgi:PAS domain S-box-containing protein
MIDDVRLPREALDALDDVFYVYDERGALAVWNDRLNDLFGLSDGQLAGMKPTEFFLPADRPAVERAVGEIFETGETVVEARAETVDGVIQFELTGRLLTGADGSVVGFAGIGRDVTDRRDEERRLAAQNDRLAEFATVVAHDLRNPLAVARGYLDLYGSTGDPVVLDRVADALDRIETIVDDVLTIAVEGRTATDVTPVPLATVARAAWATVDTGNATLDVRTEAVVDADDLRLRRLFENLFRNSVEHGSTSPRSHALEDSVEHGSTGNRSEAGDSVEHGDPAVTVAVTDTPTGFAVTDDGPGIAPADRERVFDPGVSGTSDGTGFGLYIVRTIARAHGWTVDVADHPGGGARFEFDLAPCTEGGPERAN